VRQHEIIEAKARELGAEIAGWAEDKATSAFKIPPMQRKQLRVWLDERASEFDIILYWRQDRLARKMMDFFAVVRWCLEHGKKMFSATENLGDVTDHADMLIGMLTAWKDEGSSRDTSERVTQTKDYLRRNLRWPGGKPSYGYKAVEVNPGWRLVVDDGGDNSSAVVLRSIVRRVLEGEAVNAITADLNSRRVPSPRDYLRTLKGQTIEKPSPWIARSLRVILRSRAILGEVIHDGQVQRGTDGKPLTWAEPLISHEEWDRLQSALDNAAKTKSRTATPSFALGVAFCEKCNSPLYKWSKPNSKGIVYSYYKCARSYNKASAVDPCDSKPIKCETLDETINEIVISEYGSTEIPSPKSARPASEHERQVKELGRAIAELTQDRYVRGIEVDDFDAKIAALQDEYRKLSDGDEDTSEPQQNVRPPTCATCRRALTDQCKAAGHVALTVAQTWAERDETGRRLLLVRYGFKVFAARDADGFLTVVSDGGDLSAAFQNAQ
jgi:site-specific DNA recombinase